MNKRDDGQSEEKIWQLKILMTSVVENRKEKYRGKASIFHH